MNSTEAPSDPVFLFHRSFAPRSRAPRGMVGLAALVDVIVLLFMFLLCTAPFVLQPGISLELPTAPFADGASYASVVVTVSQEGLLFVNDEQTTAAGLEGALARALHRTQSLTVLIEADARVSYSSLVRIYNLAREQGVEEVVLATRGQAP